MFLTTCTVGNWVVSLGYVVVKNEIQVKIILT